MFIIFVSQKLYDKYAGDKNIVIVEGDHNSIRPRFLQDSVAIFLQTCLQVPEEWTITGGQMYIGAMPWLCASNRNRKYQNNNEIATDSIGMTNSRQAEIQASLFSMMGKESNNTSSRSNNQQIIQPSIESSKYPELNHSDHNKQSIPSNITSQSNENIEYDHSWNAVDHEVEDLSPYYQNEEIYDFMEWTCETCTLINTSDLDCCVACGVPRMNI